MATEEQGATWREVSIREVFVDALLGGLPGAPQRLWSALLGVTALVVVLSLIELAIPVQVERRYEMFWLYFSFSMVAAVIFQGGGQIRAGRGPSRILAGIAGAVLGVAVIFAVVVFALIRVVPLIRDAGWGETIASRLPTISLGMEFWVLLLIVFLIAIGIRFNTDWGRRPSKGELRRQGFIRAERAARLAATGRESVTLLPTWMPRFGRHAEP